MQRIALAAAVLCLASSYTAHACDCTKLTTCATCSVVDEQDPCWNQCQWCIPQLECQQASEGSQSCSPYPDHPNIQTLIGPHEGYRCQNGLDGDGPTIMQAELSVDKDTIKLWDGTIGAAKSNPAPVMPVTGSSEYLLTIKGHNWGGLSAHRDQAIGFCPWLNMTSAQNPNGPNKDACFLCPQESVTPPGRMTECEFPDYQQQLCNTMTCKQIPAGIGTDLAMFVFIPGEPASMLATHDSLPYAADGVAIDGKVQINYQAPTIEKVYINGTECPADGCHGGPGDIISMDATNLPPSNDARVTYQNGHGPRSDIKVTVGADCEYEDIQIDFNANKVSCKIPVNAGTNQEISLTVGHQKVVASKKLNYPGPTVTSVTPNSIPSWSGVNITVTGKNFASQAPDAGGAQLSIVQGSRKIGCQVLDWSLYEITCKPDQYGAIAKADETTHVIITTASGASNTDTNSELKYQECPFLNTPGGLCTTEGSQECNTNYECSYPGSAQSIKDNGVCDHKSATCTCPEIKCQHGEFHKASCSCECINGWSSSSSVQIPGAFDIDGKVGQSAGVCDACAVSCGSLDKKIQTAEKCGCEFNMLNLIWIVLLVVIVLVAVGFGVWKYKKNQPGTYKALDSGKNDTVGDEDLEDAHYEEM